MADVWWSLATLAAMGALLVAPTARAEEPPVALVVESDVSPLLLRQAVAEALGRPVTTLSRARASLTGPDLVLTVSVDHDAGITVVCWDRDGTEWLVAPTPAEPEAIAHVAAGLAAALVQQRTRAMQQAAQRVPANPYLLPKARTGQRGISPFNPYYHRLGTPPGQRGT